MLLIHAHRRDCPLIIREWLPHQVRYCFFFFFTAKYQICIAEGKLLALEKQNEHQNVLRINGKGTALGRCVLPPLLCITYKLSMFLFSSCHILVGGPMRPIKEPREEKHQISSDSQEDGVLQC